MRVNGNGHSDLTAMKTPKPPGGWTSTPVGEPPLRTHSLPDEYEDSQYDSGLATPAASLSRAASLPPQTPAPPGGWMATPYRKSILKVRFDLETPESEISVSEGVGESTKSSPSGSRESPRSESSSVHMSNPQMNGALVAPPPREVKGEDVVRTRTPEPPATPLSTSPSRTIRKSPSIRVVDAFGRERASNVDDVGAKQEKQEAVPNISTPRSKSAVRIVDAMGREVDEVIEPGSESRSEEDKPVKRDEALARVREGLVDLADGLSEADRYISLCISFVSVFMCFGP